MASEIRVDKITSLSGVGTISPSTTGVEIAGITTAATLKATTGIVTTLTVTTGIVTTLTTNTLTANSTTKVGSGVTLSPDGDIFATGITTVGSRIDVISSENTLGILTSSTNGANFDLFDNDTQSRIRTVDGRLHLYADFGNDVSDSAMRFFVDGDNERVRIASGGTIHVNSPDSASGGRIYATGSALYLQSGNGRQTLKVSDAAAGVNRTIEMTSDGNLKISNAGNGIDFSSTSDASGMSNELFDDYEEGDYLPSFTLTSGSITLANTHKTLCYTKIGRQVTIIGQLKIDSVSSPSGIMRAALPFNRGNQTEQAERTMGNIMVTGAAVNNANEFTTYPDGGSDHFLEIISISGTTINRNGGDNMQAGAYIYVNYTYFAA